MSLVLGPRVTAGPRGPNSHFSLNMYTPIRPPNHHCIGRNRAWTMVKNRTYRCGHGEACNVTGRPDPEPCSTNHPPWYRQARQDGGARQAAAPRDPGGSNEHDDAVRGTLCSSDRPCSDLCPCPKVKQGPRPFLCGARSVGEACQLCEACEEAEGDHVPPSNRCGVHSCTTIGGSTGQ